MGVPVRVLPLATSRSAKHLASRSRRIALLATTALALPMLFVALPITPAAANIDGSTFDAGDGNLVVNDEPKDWANVDPFKFGIDSATGKNDSSFAGGVDEDTVNPGVRTG